jgi:hypothetical protein
MSVLKCNDSSLEIPQEILENTRSLKSLENLSLRIPVEKLFLLKVLLKRSFWYIMTTTLESTGKVLRN